MNVCIFSAKTGNGHYAVSRAIYERLQELENVEVNVIYDFYEQLSPYTSILSDFYNLLQTRSKALCKMFTEMSCMENIKKQDEIYNLIETSIGSNLKKYSADVILSITPLINRYMIKYIKSNSMQTKYYEVITDPFLPMYPGFDSLGADGYFCPTQIVYDYLREKGISEFNLFMTGYPVRKNFLCTKKKHNNIESRDQFTFLLNSGSNGNINYIHIMESLCLIDVKREIKIILLCGNNTLLYKMASQKYKDNPNVDVKLYEDNIHIMLETVDLCMTKPGANTIFECINMKVPILVDGIDGLLFQESGIDSFLKEWSVGEVVYSIDDILEKLKKIIYHYDTYADAVNRFPMEDGVGNILSQIITNHRERDLDDK